MRPTIFKNTELNPNKEDPRYLIWDLDEQKKISSFKRLETALEALKYWKEKKDEQERN